MKIKLLNRVAGPDGNYPPGFVITVSELEAKQLIDSGYAVCAEVQPQEKKPKKAVK